MNNLEISIKEIYQTYRSYWWVVVVVFVVGAVVGFLLPDAFRADVYITEFTLPVVVRQQPTTNWKEEDTYALMGFVNAWFDQKWTSLAGEHIPGAQAFVILRKDTFHFSVEVEDCPAETEVVRQIAGKLYAEFLNDFIAVTGSSDIQFVEQDACLTDAAQPMLVECVPLTNELAMVIQRDTFDLGAILWTGEVSEVVSASKFPYSRYLQTVAAGVCAEMLLVLWVLVDLTRKSGKVK